MTFPGESIALDYANPISGTIADWGSAMRYRAGSEIVDAGESFLAGFYDYQYADEATSAVASVVLVLGSASAGSVRVSYGVDPDYNLTDSALATQGLGTHDVSGASELVLPIPGFDLAAMVNYDHEQLAFVEVLSGSVEIVQIKFRLWPVGGFTGAWVPGEPSSFTSTGVALNHISESGGAVQGYGPDLESAYADAVAEWNSRGNMRALTPGGGFAQSLVELFNNGVETTGTVHLSVGALWVSAPWVGSVVNATSQSITHPDEVPGEPGMAVRNPDGSPVLYGFGGWAAGTLRIESDTALRTVGGTPWGPLTPSVSGVASIDTAASAPPIYPDPLGGMLRYTDRVHAPASGYAIPPATSFEAATPDVTVLPLPASPSFLLTYASFGWYSRPLDNYYEYELGGWEYHSRQTDRAKAIGFEAVVTVPPHLVWDPEATPEPQHKPTRITGRGDGLAMGAPRLKDRGSNQLSERVVRGYY